MRALAAVIIFAACLLRSRAFATVFRDVTNHDGIPLLRLAKCTTTIGLSKCLGALAAYRAENALSSIKEQKVDFSLARDVKNFPWEHYTNKTEDEMYTQLCDGTEKLLQYRSLKFNMIPGYELKLLSNGNGTLNVDLFKSQPDTERSMKKLRKKFYEVVPLLLLPGLIMSAILPFVLPAMKMMTVAVGMLNNMALSGAIFTLLRNNAFNDKYDKKVIYVNEGYHNEKHANHDPDHFLEFEGHESQTNVVAEIPGDHFEIVDDTPSNQDFTNQYYVNLLKVARKDYRRVRGG